MWDLIASVPDHCLSFYFTLLLSGVTFYIKKKTKKKKKRYVNRQSDQCLLWANN